MVGKMKKPDHWGKNNQKHRKDKMLKKTNLMGIHRLYGINQAKNPVGTEETEVEAGASQLISIFTAGILSRTHSPLGRVLKLQLPETNPHVM